MEQMWTDAINKLKGYTRVNVVLFINNKRIGHVGILSKYIRQKRIDILQRAVELIEYNNKLVIVEGDKVKIEFEPIRNRISGEVSS